MDRESLSPRLRRLPVVSIGELLVPVAVGRRARALGLSHLDRSEVGAGLLIPRCASVHTFGMRFDLDLVFLGPAGEVVSVRREAPPRRVLSSRGAASVLELAADSCLGRTYLVPERFCEGELDP